MPGLLLGLGADQTGHFSQAWRGPAEGQFQVPHTVVRRDRQTILDVLSSTSHDGKHFAFDFTEIFRVPQDTADEA